MAITVRPNQNIQVQSFWNLIQSSDERVQKELYVLLQSKYGGSQSDKEDKGSTFLQLQGVLKGKGSQETDKRMLDEYLKEKYDV